MRTLTETIKAHEDRLERYDLTLVSKELAQDTLHHLKSHHSLLKVITDEMIPTGEKFCYRYGGWAVEGCSVCESCLKPEDLACNEGEE